MDQPDTAAIHLRYKLSSREVARATRAQVTHSRIAWVVTAALVVLSIVRLRTDPPDVGPLSDLILILLLVLVVPLAVGLIQRRQLEPVEIVIDDSGIFSKASTSESHLDWSFFTSAREVPGAYMLMRGWLQAVMVPKRAFEDAASEETFRALCANHTKTRFA